MSGPILLDYQYAPGFDDGKPSIEEPRGHNNVAFAELADLGVQREVFEEVRTYTLEEGDATKQSANSVFRRRHVGKYEAHRSERQAPTFDGRALRLLPPLRLGICFHDLLDEIRYQYSDIGHSAIVEKIWVV